jgi:hypothetical protein
MNDTGTPELVPHRVVGATLMPGGETPLFTEGTAKLLKLYALLEHLPEMLDTAARRYHADAIQPQTNDNYPWLRSYEFPYFGRVCLFLAPPYAGTRIAQRCPAMYVKRGNAPTRFVLDALLSNFYDYARSVGERLERGRS